MLKKGNQLMNILVQGIGLVLVWFGFFLTGKKIMGYLYTYDYRMLTRESLCHLIVTAPSELYVHGM